MAARAPRLHAGASRLLLGVALAGLAAVPASLLRTIPSHASGFDSASAEAQLAQEINAERAANGRAPLAVNAVLSDIARGAPHSVCGGPVLHGRSQDMIERGYFSHQVPPCGALVWPVLTSRGIQYSSAAENIGWNNVSPQAASVDQMNSQLMASPDHRANILGNFNQVGVGVFAVAGNWGYNGLPGVVMYTEIFTLGSLPPRTAPPPPSPPRLPARGTPAPVVAPAPPIPAPPVATPRAGNNLAITSRNGCIQARDLAKDGALWCSWEGAVKSAWAPWLARDRWPARADAARANPLVLLWSYLSSGLSQAR